MVEGNCAVCGRDYEPTRRFKYVCSEQCLAVWAEWTAKERGVPVELILGQWGLRSRASI